MICYINPRSDVHVQGHTLHKAFPQPFPTLVKKICHKLGLNARQANGEIGGNPIATKHTSRTVGGATSVNPHVLTATPYKSVSQPAKQCSGDYMFTCR